MERFHRRSFAPISVGEEIDLEIETIGAKGDGIGKKITKKCAEK